MSRRRVVIAIAFFLVPVAVAAGLLINGLLPVSNGQAQGAGVQTGRVTLTPEEEISQLLQQARAVLTKVDDALEYPMTASERRRSDWQVEDARWELSRGKSREWKTSELQYRAREARNLAEQALEAARAGERERAIKRFTQARVKMQETRIGLEDNLRARYGRSIGSTAGVHDPLSAGGTSAGARREVFTIRAPGVNGAILFGRDGIRIQGETDDEVGGITIGPDGVRVSGREGRRDWGRVDIDREGVRIEGED